MVQEPLRGYRPINFQSSIGWAQGVNDRLKEQHWLYFTASTDQIQMKQFINCQLDPLGIGCGLRDRPACRLLASAETKFRALKVLSLFHEGEHLSDGVHNTPSGCQFYVHTPISETPDQHPSFCLNL
jgi:hypothetical protein